MRGETPHGELDFELDWVRYDGTKLSDVNEDLGWILTDKTEGDATTAVKMYKRGGES